MIELLFLLLPVAAVSGWWAARRSLPREAATSSGNEPVFFRGLNYLLDEQPDKAIDVFLKLAEVDRETVDTHLALGSLFRRRGEVDRAIRIHQNLVARSNLEHEERGYALYELGQDYMRAGLFDRAEGLFRELLELSLQPERALRALAEIYQQEKDWFRCLEVAERLQARGAVPMSAEIAHYHCELAEDALRGGTEEAAAQHLREAQASDPNCARALMLQAEMAIAHQDAAVAMRYYEALLQQAPQYLPEILPKLLDCFRRLGHTSLSKELEQLYRKEPSPPLMLSLVETLRHEEGDQAATDLLLEHLRRHADLAGLTRLLELQLPQTQGQMAEAMTVSLGTLRHLLARQPAYQCEHCGFTARRLHWQCPSCKRWGTVNPSGPEPIDQASQWPREDTHAN